MNDQRHDLSWIGHSLLVSAQNPPAQIEVCYELPVQKTVEHIDGDDYHLTWRGDDVVGLAPNTDFLPFYPTPD